MNPGLLLQRFVQRHVGKIVKDIKQHGVYAQIDGQCLMILTQGQLHKGQQIALRDDGEQLLLLRGQLLLRLFRLLGFSFQFGRSRLLRLRLGFRLRRGSRFLRLQPWCGDRFRGRRT